MVRKKVIITKSRTAKLNSRLRRLDEVNPPQAAADLATLMRSYGLRKWGGKSLGGLDIQANTGVYVSDVNYEGNYWIGESDTPSRRMRRYSAGQRVIALHTPNFQQALVFRSERLTMVPSAAARSRPTVPFSTEYGNSLEVHNHRPPGPHAATTLLWKGCCGNAAHIGRKEQRPLIELVGMGGTLAEITDWLFPLWLKRFGPATLVDLGPRG